MKITKNVDWYHKGEGHDAESIAQQNYFSDHLGLHVSPNVATGGDHVSVERRYPLDTLETSLNTLLKAYDAYKNGPEADIKKVLVTVRVKKRRVVKKCP